MTALLIAVLHSIAVFAAGALWRSRAALWVVTGVMSVVAVLAGNDAYWVLDLFAVLLAAWLTDSWLKTPKPAKPRDGSIAAPVREAEFDRIAKAWVDEQANPGPADEAIAEMKRQMLEEPGYAESIERFTLELRQHNVRNAVIDARLDEVERLYEAGKMTAEERLEARARILPG